MSSFAVLPKLQDKYGLVVAFSQKSLGNMSFLYGRKEEVAANRRRFAEEVGVKPDRFVTLWLSHGITIAIAGRNDRKNIGDDKPSFQETDAVITAEKNLFLFFCAADCWPLIFYDPKNKILATAHLGWKGAVGKLHLLVPLKMNQLFGSRFEDLVVGVGPSLRQECSSQPRPVLQEELPEWKGYLQVVDKQRICVDGLKFILDGLAGMGVLRRNIEISLVCTACHHAEFFSHEAVQRGLDKEKEGRFGVVVGMV